MFSSFAGVGLLLAALGLFAVASFDVALRRYELSVRGALGASAAALRRLVIADVLRPVALGCGAGVVAAWWLAQFIQSQLHQVDARDPGTLALVVAVLLLTAIAAAWLPAYRAGRTDPAEVLRAQ
jgi:putative ABC transport system permease protein